MNDEEAQKIIQKNSEEFMSFLPQPTDEIETYDATCHCGTVQYSVILSPPLAKQKVCSCNCSNCSRHGYLLVYPSREKLSLKSGEDALKVYTFGRKRNQHKFCTNCGCMVFFDPRMKEFGEGPPDLGLDLLGVNVSAI